MERAQYKTTNGRWTIATPDAPDRIDRLRRCTGHGRRTPDGGLARGSASPYRRRACGNALRRATPDAPEHIDHLRRCTGHGRRTR